MIQRGTKRIPRLSRLRVRLYTQLFWTVPALDRSSIAIRCRPHAHSLLISPSARAVSLFGALPLPTLRWGAVGGGSSLLMTLHVVALHLMALLRRVLLAFAIGLGASLGLPGLC